MSEIEYGDLFDGYCREFLEALYERRGRAISTTIDGLIGDEPSDIPRETRASAWETTLEWVRRHGYAEVEGRDDGKFIASITPLGISLIGKPLPGAPGSGPKKTRRPNAAPIVVI